MKEASGQRFLAQNHCGVFSPDRLSKANRAIQFDGLSSFISIDSALAMDSTFTSATFACWILPSRFPACLFAKNDNICFVNDYAIILDSSSISVRVADTSYIVSLNSGLQPGIWSHLAVVWDGDTIKCYLNGILSGSRLCTGVLFPMNKEIFIGKNYDATQYLSGKMDDLRIANYAFDAATINTIANSIDTNKFLALVKPQEGELLKAGSTYALAWASNGLTGVKIEYTTNADSNWLIIATSAPADLGNYFWNVPAAITSSNCKIRLSDAGNANYISTSDQPFSILTISDTLPYVDLTALLEGFYDPGSGLMIPDTVKLGLYAVDTTYHRIDSLMVRLDSLGRARGYFHHSTRGVYYVVIKHRNHLETWSHAPVNFALGSITRLDFSQTQDSAYANNLAPSGSRWCLYGGDVDQDGYIDNNDLFLVNQDAYNYREGYARTDVDGNGFVDNRDLMIIDANAFNFIRVQRPPLQGAKKQQAINRQTVSKIKD
jgi:hypothetical protein